MACKLDLPFQAKWQQSAPQETRDIFDRLLLRAQGWFGVVSTSLFEIRITASLRVSSNFNKPMRSFNDLKYCERRRRVSSANCVTNQKRGSDG